MVIWNNWRQLLISTRLWKDARRDSCWNIRIDWKKVLAGQDGRAWDRLKRDRFCDRIELFQQHHCPSYNMMLLLLCYTWYYHHITTLVRGRVHTYHRYFSVYHLHGLHHLEWCRVQTSLSTDVKSATHSVYLWIPLQFWNRWLSNRCVKKACATFSSIHCFVETRRYCMRHLSVWINTPYCTNMCQAVLLTALTAQRYVYNFLWLFV